MGSGNFLHRGSQEPCAVLENPLKTVMIPPMALSLGLRGERGRVKGLQEVGVTRQVLPATGAISASDQDLNTLSPL